VSFLCHFQSLHHWSAKQILKELNYSHFTGWINLQNIRVFSPPNCFLHTSSSTCLFILGTHGTMTSWSEKMSLSVCGVAIETSERFCQFSRIWMWWTPVLHSFETCEIWRLRVFFQRDYKSTSNMTWTSIKDQRLRGADGSGTDSLIVCLFKCSYIKKLHNRYRPTRDPVSWFRYCRPQLCLTNQLYDKERDMTMLPLTKVCHFQS